MSDYNVTYPKDSIVIPQVLTTKIGGATVDATGLLLEVVEAGSIVINNSGLKVMPSGISHNTAASGGNTIQLEKGHTFKVGDLIKAATITAIDQSNAAYDSVTCSGTFGTAITLAEALVTNGNLAVGVVITSKVINEDKTVDVGVMTRGVVNEAALRAPVNSAVKTALPLIQFITE